MESSEDVKAAEWSCGAPDADILLCQPPSLGHTGPLSADSGGTGAIHTDILPDLSLF